MVTCCVVCELGDATLPTSVLQELLTVEVSLIAGMEDPEVKSKCLSLEEDETKSFQDAAQRTIDAHGEQEARLLHRRFHQKRVLEMEGFPYYPLEFGSIMQFLVSADSVETPEWEIIQLLKAAVRHVPCESRYSELTGVPLVNSLSICLGTGETTMYHPNDVTAVWHMELGDLELDDRLQELQRQLIPLESVCMIAIYDAELSDEGEVADAQNLINFLNGVYGEMDEMMVILVHSRQILESQLGNPHANSDELFSRLNRNADQDTLARTKFINVIGDDLTISTCDLAGLEE